MEKELGDIIFFLKVCVHLAEDYLRVSEARIKGCRLAEF